MSHISFENIYAYSDREILKAIGAFIKHHRLALNLSQQELAKKTAISRSTLSLLERGETVTTITLVKVCRMLEQLNVFSQFEVTNELSPMMLLKMQEKKRKRARKKDDDSSTETKNLDW